MQKKYTNRSNPAYRHSGLLQANIGGLSFRANDPSSVSEIWILRSEIWHRNNEKNHKPVQI